MLHATLNSDYFNQLSPEQTTVRVRMADMGTLSHVTQITSGDGTEARDKTSNQPGLRVIGGPRAGNRSCSKNIYILQTRGQKENWAGYSKMEVASWELGFKLKRFGDRAGI